jgi:hypothetical protein
MADVQRVTGTHFGFDCVKRVLRSVPEAATSLRGAAGVVRIRLQDESGHSAAQLSHNTVRNLVQRIGLYEIPRERPVADDWIWMIDHTIQAGTRKCFVVMGIRQADFLKRDRPLEHRDRGIDREISWGTSALALPERVRAGEVTRRTTSRSSAADPGRRARMAGRVRSRPGALAGTERNLSANLCDRAAFRVRPGAARASPRSA